jgi:RNA polymerase sigma-70 factor (ECF subfamily)
MGTTENFPNSILPNSDAGEACKVPKELLERAAAGDSQAFTAIYDLYAGKIFSFASHMTGQREDAEDITQNTFLLAFRNLKNLREHEHFEQWLYKIARNEVYKKGRKWKFRLDSLDDEDNKTIHILRSVDPAGDPENKLLSAELGDRIRKVFRKLPMQYKETLVLATLQGLSYQEISGILGRSVSSVKMDVHRARLMISEKIQR